MMMEDDASIFEKINKSKRKLLMAFLKNHDGRLSKIIPACSRDSLPLTNRKDKGMLPFFFVCRNIYNPEYYDFWILIDILDQEGKESFKKYHKYQEEIAELIAPEILAAREKPSNTYNPEEEYLVSRKKAGRPRRVFSAEERQQIDAMKAGGQSIASIARKLRASNRLIIDYLKSNGK